MLEANVEFESDLDRIQNNDVLYLMNENQSKVPSTLLDLDPRHKFAIERSDLADNIGRAMINLANIPNGVYIIRYLRFQEPVSLKSQI